MENKIDIEKLMDGVSSDELDTSFITDATFDSVSKDVHDSLFGILANAGIAIAEQKKLLQTAKTPEALQNAIKLFAVTAGNLMGASTGMLSWLGRKSRGVHGRDEAPYEAFTKDGKPVVYQRVTDGRTFAITDSADGFSLALGYDSATGDCDESVSIYKTVDEAKQALSDILDK